MKFIEVNRNDISKMNYYSQLTAPMDDMYDEGIIPSCTFFQIEDKEDICGYFAVNEENTIMQFFLSEEKRENADSIFHTLIARKGLKKSLCGTNDPLFYKQCTRQASSKEIHDFMFHEDGVVTKSIPFEGILIESPVLDDLDEILTYFDGIGMKGEWLSWYMAQRIETGSIHLFRYEGDIIGSGEVRPSRCNSDYANVGMTVSADYRRRGLGTYILSTMRHIANKKGLKAICSTDSANTASFNTIIKSGFICYHKIEEISF